MKHVAIRYRNHLGEDLSVELDFENRQAKGPGARKLERIIRSWEEYVKRTGDRYIAAPWRNAVRIDHPWASPRDMAVFMSMLGWDDLDQWPPEFAALVPPPAPLKEPENALFVLY